MHGENKTRRKGERPKLRVMAVGIRRIERNVQNKKER